MSKVIKGGTIVTADREWKSDILIEGEIIKQIGNNLTADEVVDAEGAYVIPWGYRSTYSFGNALHGNHCG